MNLPTKLLALGTLAFGCAEAGTVIDVTTGRPIANAIVVATWEGTVVRYVQTQSGCYKFEIATTDNQGRFSISPVSGNLDPSLTHRSFDMFAIARGYRMSKSYKPDSTEILMEPMSGTASEQFKELPKGALGCVGDEKAWLPYLKALQQYKEELASTTAEKAEVIGLLYQIDEIELGTQEARRRDERRRQELYGGKR